MNRRELLKSLPIAACASALPGSSDAEPDGVMRFPKKTIRVNEPMLGVLACGIYGNKEGTCGVRFTGKFKREQMLSFLKRIVATMEREQWPSENAAGIGNIKESNLHD